MEPNLCLELINGSELEASSVSPFMPDENEINVILSKNNKRCKYLLSEVCCILMNDIPDHEIDAHEIDTADDELEELETISGKLFHVRVIKGRNYRTGFYAVSVESHIPYKFVFFPFDGVKSRNQHNHLGEILEKKGIVPHSDIEAALEKQHSLKSRRVGEILSEQNQIEMDDVEKVLRESYQSGKIPPTTRVGDILIAEGLVTRQQVDEALASQKTGKRKKIGELLVECGFVSEDQILAALSTKFRMQFVKLNTLTPDDKALKALPEELVHRIQIFPIHFSGDYLVVATSKPTDPSIFNILRFSTNRKIELVVATSNDISEAIKKYFPKDEDIQQLITDEVDDYRIIPEEEEQENSVLNESDSKIVRLCNKILIDGFEKGVSDIHFEPGMQNSPLIVRYRSEGSCKVVHSIPSMYKKPLISRIKIISGLDITEHRMPQSGKILFSINKKKVEYRVEITPTVGGNEDAVLRILSSGTPLSIDEMGFSLENLRHFKKILGKPYGIILCVGPTGSGKTTTLHSALRYINLPTRKIWTAEDPVEITQPGLRQVQVLPKIGFTFEKALRSFLRADPDVIMIGEMRDSETTKIAIQSSLTGHLVFSTLHTNSAAETITRLIEMGIEPLNFSDAMLGILSQRLTLRLCKHCKKSYHPSREEYEELANTYGLENFKAHNMKNYSEDFMLMKKVGCEICEDSGYKGRIALHELLIETEEVKNAIKKRMHPSEIEKLMIKSGMKTLKMDGIDKIFKGLTDLSQVLKVCA